MEGGSTSVARLVLVLGVALAASGAHRANATEVKEIFSFRWRYESFDTLSNDSALDSQYDFHNLRTRFGADVRWNRFTVHGLLQAANAVSLPDKGSFGPGRVYFVSSGGEDTSSAHLGLAELMVAFKLDALSFRAGRQGMVDGQEVLTGDARFDWVKQTRLSERLVGTWDWVNVGRRFDGGTVSYDRPRFNLTGFGARVLQGGVDYAHAFEPLDGVDVGAVSYTAKRSAWITGSEVRLFDVLYRDSRASTRASLGDRIFIQGIGASFVGMYARGSGTADVVAWFALETGDYGTSNQGGSALILEGGYGWPRRKTAPWLRLGVATASGDDDPTDRDHGTFFKWFPRTTSTTGTRISSPSKTSRTSTRRPGSSRSRACGSLWKGTRFACGADGTLGTAARARRITRASATKHEGRPGRSLYQGVSDLKST